MFQSAVFTGAAMEPCRHEHTARGLRQARGLESLLTALQGVEW